MNVFEKIYRQAKKIPKKIVLPEGEEPRVIKAASFVTERRLAQIILLGKRDIILKIAKKNRFNLSKVEILNPREDQASNAYIDSYWNLRKHKGITLPQARDLLLQKFVYYGAMMLAKGRVDGFVAGACYRTSDVARACLHCIDKTPQRSTVSGSFLMEIKDRKFGERGLFLFADCGIVPLPSKEQLAAIAITSAEVWVKVTGYQPRIAMLSFSTKGSGSHACVDKVREAAEIVRKTKSDLLVDGEMQLDSAVVPAVAKIKVPNSLLAGKANILIFPNLDAGNIAYKLMQRLAKARVVGPLIQGLVSPCSDLSRGCSWQEIVDAIAVTAVRAQ